MSYFFAYSSSSPELKTDNNNNDDSVSVDLDSIPTENMEEDFSESAGERDSENLSAMSAALSRLIVRSLSNTARLPVYSSDGAAGMDVHAAEEVTIPAGEYKKVGTGIAIEWRSDYPESYYMRVAPRSGLAARNGINVGAGVIDSDYRGEISVILFNHGKEPYTASIGDRIAQLIWTRCDQIDRIEWAADDGLTETARGTDGFGSTGV